MDKFLLYQEDDLRSRDVVCMTGFELGNGATIYDCAFVAFNDS